MQSGHKILLKSSAGPLRRQAGGRGGECGAPRCGRPLARPGWRRRQHHSHRAVMTHVAPSPTFPSLAEVLHTVPRRCSLSAAGRTGSSLARPPAGRPAEQHHLQGPANLCLRSHSAGSLTALVCQHSITPLALPCKLLIPDRGMQPGPRATLALGGSPLPCGVSGTQGQLRKGSVGTAGPGGTSSLFSAGEAGRVLPSGPESGTREVASLHPHP